MFEREGEMRDFFCFFVSWSQNLFRVIKYVSKYMKLRKIFNHGLPVPLFLFQAGEKILRVTGEMGTVFTSELVAPGDDQ